MLDPQGFVDRLKEKGIRFFTGVPDSLLKELCSCIAHRSRPGEHIIAANEGGALALALGYHLATQQIPLVYMQNSGVGNMINPLLSLADKEVYSIPMLLVIGWRGEPGVHDEPQHKKQGQTMLPLLEAMRLPFSVLDPDSNDPAVVLQDALAYLRQAGAPFALVARKGTFKPFTGSQAERPDFSLSREEAIQQVIDVLGERDIVVSTTGMSSRELYEYRRKRGDGHQRDFLTVGGMGHASQIALGIAIQKPERSVYCLDGDGALLMHMGGLALVGTLKPNNYRHIVLNNGAHDSVGGQPTVALDIDILGIARAVGYERVARARTVSELRSCLQDLTCSPGPSLLEIQVRCGSRNDLGRPETTPIQNKNAFMDFLGSAG